MPTNEKLKLTLVRNFSTLFIVDHCLLDSTALLANSWANQSECDLKLWGAPIRLVSKLASFESENGKRLGGLVI